jgi:ABC-2 type transport system permease protein
MSNATYVKYELLRTFRNRRFFVLSIGMPLVLYFTIAGPNRNEHNLGGSGIDAPLYFMVGLIAFGTMNSILAAGARIANERSVGWTRQLRLTPLSSRAYFRTKVLTGYLTAGLTIALLYVAGASLGVSLSASAWVRMTIFILVGLIPFAAIGIWLGHLLTPDSIGPALGGTTAILSLLGGVWFPVTNGVMKGIAESLPSYWLVQGSHVALGGSGWGWRGWLVVGLWTAAAAAMAMRAYRRDTGRT